MIVDLSIDAEKKYFSEKDIEANPTKTSAVRLDCERREQAHQALDRVLDVIGLVDE